MTKASVLSADMLFATLDPTLRAVALPHGARIILSDTVGFISDLPTMLIAAFRATLEEVVEADVILHIRDISHEDAEAQSRDVEKILRELGIDAGQEVDSRRSLIEVWNKIDRLEPAARERLANIVQRRAPSDRPVLVSAMTGEGLEGLTEVIESRLAARREVIELRLDPADGAGVSWLHRHTEVLDKSIDENGAIAMTVRADPDKAARLRARFSNASAVTRRH
jgi:GTP-binding protein HflX